MMCGLEHIPSLTLYNSKGKEVCDHLYSSFFDRFEVACPAVIHALHWILLVQFFITLFTSYKAQDVHFPARLWCGTVKINKAGAV